LILGFLDLMKRPMMNKITLIIIIKTTKKVTKTARKLQLSASLLQKIFKRGVHIRIYIKIEIPSRLLAQIFIPFML
jgi:hypothetical protein